jgi:DNA-nicking Smr family endonuclease
MAKKKASRAPARRRASDEVEAFFRPFAKLKLDKPESPAKEALGKGAPAEKNAASKDAVAAKGAPASKGAAKPPLGGAPSAPPAARVSPADAKLARATQAANEAPIAPVDPDTFAIYMAGVKALERGATRIPLTASRLERATPSAAPAADPDAAARAQMRSLVSEGVRFETTDDGEHVEGRRMDVDPRELRLLRRGRYAIDGKLDLHGLLLLEARAAVEAFVKKRATDGDKVVAIIHGKGTHSPRQLAVLRGEIGAWLSQGRASRHIRAFATAPAEDGGGGAVLVMLAR